MFCVSQSDSKLLVVPYFCTPVCADPRLSSAICNQEAEQGCQGIDDHDLQKQHPVHVGYSEPLSADVRAPVCPNSERSSVICKQEAELGIDSNGQQNGQPVVVSVRHSEMLRGVSTPEFAGPGLITSVTFKQESSFPVPGISSPVCSGPGLSSAICKQEAALVIDGHGQQQQQYPVTSTVSQSLSLPDASTPAICPEKVEQLGPRLVAAVCQQQVAEFIIDGSKSDSGELAVMCSGPSRPAICELVNQQNRICQIRVQPQEHGCHQLFITFDDKPIEGSPFSMMVMSSTEFRERVLVSRHDVRPVHHQPTARPRRLLPRFPLDSQQSVVDVLADHNVHKSSPDCQVQPRSFPRDGNETDFTRNCYERVDTPGRPYKCEVCVKAFVRRDDLTNHQRKHTGEHAFICDVCGKTFSRNESLIIHQRLHTGERPYKCNVCGKAFTFSSCWRSHQLIHTGKRVQKCKCDICGKAFQQSCQLAKHRLIHTEERPYKCIVCDRAFGRKESLAKHNRTHTGQGLLFRPYVCDVCGYACTQKGNLAIHKRVHTGERPYKCDECGCAFTQCASLRYHMRIHTGEKAYKCDKCECAFRHSTTLRNHMRIHSRERLQV